jgi:hypothetical protein
MKLNSNFQDFGPLFLIQDYLHKISRKDVVENLTLT